MKLLVVLAPFIGFCLGYNLAETPAQAKARVEAHDHAVVAAVEAGARRYSVYVGGDQNLIPDWAKEPRIPLFELDRSYRHP